MHRGCIPRVPGTVRWTETIPGTLASASPPQASQSGVSALVFTPVCHSSTVETPVCCACKGGARMKRWPMLLLASGVAFGFVPARAVAERTAAERGRETLLGRAFSPPIASLQAYDQLWKQWGLPAKPADYER